MVQRSAPVPNKQKATSWLGAPLKTSQGVIGLIVCQAYNNKHIFSQDDNELITFVSHQIAAVLQTKLANQAIAKSHQELEFRVNEKTKELQQTNLHLQMQIEERKKIEQQLYHGRPSRFVNKLAKPQFIFNPIRKNTSTFSAFSRASIAVLFIDLDKFKDINDQLGHQAGDQFLINVSELFSQCIREHDLLARLGGDEFVILLTHLTEPQQAEDVANRIIDLMKKPFNIKGTLLQSGASIGIKLLKTKL